MPSLLSKLRSSDSQRSIEPREIFMGLTKRDDIYQYPRDVQTDVWKKWFSVRDEKNCIIKMNTGSGKTVVGLLILQSCLNENKGPAAYVVPDKFLVSQVCSEAEKLGINYTDNRDDYLYSEHKSILVMPIHTLVNGKSVFGMNQASHYPLGSILIDDVHACLNTISKQYSVKVPYKYELYKEMISVFADRWKSYNQKSFTEIVEYNDPTKSFLIPFWMWQDSVDVLLQVLRKYCNNNFPEIFFSLPLLEENLSMCNCIISAAAIEIIPFGILINKIKSFDEAQRRIFMSATLTDDSVFVTNIGLHKEDLSNIITPENANDIGDRLILFPRHLNSRISDIDIKDKVIETSFTYNVVVIVPSQERAKFWDPSGNCTATSGNIDDIVSKLKADHIGLVVFVNRYDGIDLPGDACRMLVIDGLPPLKNGYDQYIHNIDSNSHILLQEQVQRIEQGMGRGVRSNSDSCCIILMGDKLADVLVRNKGISFFSKATAEQYKLSKELWDLLKQEKYFPTIDDIWDIADYSLRREDDWIKESKSRLSTLRYDCTPNVDPILLLLREAYESGVSKQWEKAVNKISEAVNKDLPISTKGYLMQLKASYLNFIDQRSAQEALLSAHKFNTNTLTPIRGIQYSKSNNKEPQSKNMCQYAEKISDKSNDYILHWDSIASSLVFSPYANEFEQALRDVGELLGFSSTRPDQETRGAGPDNLWAIGNHTYFVIECKSGAEAGTISKDYCNQLGGSIRWFESEYGQDNTVFPIIVHKSNLIDEQATPVKDMRVITSEKLAHFKENISKLLTAFTQTSNWMDESRLQQLLAEYHLRGQDIINEYTIYYRSKNQI